jgi:hypothetical protein
MSPTVGVARASIGPEGWPSCSRFDGPPHGVKARLRLPLRGCGLDPVVRPSAKLPLTRASPPVTVGD